MMSTESQVIQAYFTGQANLDPQAWRQTLADDAIIYDPVGKPPHKASDDWQKFYRILSSLYDKFEIRREFVYATDTDAAVKWTMHITAKNGRTASTEGMI